MKLPGKQGFFRQYFFNARVFSYLAIGTAVIFLTFFTDNNALEIAISGIASIFIGIGVNNLSILETQTKDQEKLGLKMEHALKMMELTQSKIKRIKLKMNAESLEEIKFELDELGEIIGMNMEMLREEINQV